MKSILTASIALMIVPCAFGRPVPAFGIEDEGGLFPDIGGVTGEELPDFGGLKGNDGKNEVDVVAPPGTPPAAEKPPAKEEKPPGEKPPAQGEEPVPERTPKEEKPPAKVEEKPKPAAEEKPKPTEEKKGEEKPPAKTEEKPPDKPDENPPEAYDADKEIAAIEAITLKPNASPKTIEGFTALKAAAKRSAEEAKARAAEVAELKKAPPAAPEVAKELEETKKQVAELERYRMTRELGNDPKLKAEYEGKVTSSETALFDYLTSPSLGMKKENADKIKAMGLDSPEGRAYLGVILKNIEAKVPDPAVQIKARRLIEARINVAEEHAAKLAELQADAGGYAAKAEAERAQGEKKWTEDVTANVVKMTNENPEGYSWAFLKAEPATGSTPEIAAKVAAHNKEVNEVHIPKFQEMVGGLNARDPEFVTKAAIAYVHAGILEKRLAEVTAAKDARIKELEERQAELEEYAGGVTRVARAAPSTAPVSPREDFIGREVSAEESIDQFLTEAGKKAQGL